MEAARYNFYKLPDRAALLDLKNPVFHLCLVSPFANFFPFKIHKPSFLVVPPAGLEPATLGLEGRCSIQLSYRGVTSNSRRRPYIPIHTYKNQSTKPLHTPDHQNKIRSSNSLNRNC